MDQTDTVVPYPVAVAGYRRSQVRACSKFAQFTVRPPSGFPLFELDGPESSAYPFIEPIPEARGLR